MTKLPGTLWPLNARLVTTIALFSPSRKKLRTVYEFAGFSFKLNRKGIVSGNSEVYFQFVLEITV